MAYVRLLVGRPLDVSGVLISATLLLVKGAYAIIVLLALVEDLARHGFDGSRSV